MAMALFAAYLSIQRPLQCIVPDERATRQLASRGVSNFAQSSRESENNAAALPADAAGCPEELNLRYWAAWVMLVSGVDFPIEIAKVRQSVHRQAVFVFFALDVHFHQMPGKPFTGPLRLGTVCKSAVYAESAVNG